MTKVDCGRGHIYDADMYPACPYCDNFKTVDFVGILVGESGATMPGNMSASARGAAMPGSVSVGAGGVTMPGQGSMFPDGQRSVVEDGRTLPPRGYEMRVDAEHKTVGRMKREQGMEPVVGWLVCIEGSDRGKDYHLYGRINTVGRNENMDVCIHGDTGITRDTHVKIAYDPKKNNFYIVPGNASDNTYLNDEPVYMQTRLNAYDLIEMGETKLLFIPLCEQRFSWSGGLNRGGEDHAVF